jgi:hypothetical protein
MVVYQTRWKSQDGCEDLKNDKPIQKDLRWFLRRGVVSTLKLPALKGGASRRGNLILYCAPCPALKGGACRALAGQKEKLKHENNFRGEVTKKGFLAYFVNFQKSKTLLKSKPSD